MRRLSIALCLPALVIGAASCGYSTRGLYPPDIQTVAVPVFTSQSLRLGIEAPMTTRVIQMIEARTHFKVVDESCADTLLVGTIQSLDKLGYGLDGLNQPRGGVMNIQITVKWIDKRTGRTLAEGEQKIDGLERLLRASDPYLIDTAQSQGVSYQKMIEQMADYVVTLLQNPW